MFGGLPGIRLDDPCAGSTGRSSANQRRLTYGTPAATTELGSDFGIPILYPSKRDCVMGNPMLDSRAAGRGALHTERRSPSGLPTRSAAAAR